jgi:hypothetical protein
LNGELAFTNGTVSGVAIDSAAAAFSYSNLVWQVPALAIAQSKTRLEISGSENDATRDYHWRVRGALDPECLRPFLTASNAARGFSIVQFSAPVNLDAEVWGRLYDYDGIGATGRVALTNFTLRGQSMDSVTGELSYTNRVLEFSHLNLWRGAQTMTADLITLDFNQRLIIFKNGYRRSGGHHARHRPKDRPYHGAVSFSRAADGVGGGLPAAARHERGA